MLLSSRSQFNLQADYLVVYTLSEKRGEEKRRDKKKKEKEGRERREDKKKKERKKGDINEKKKRKENTTEEK